MATKKPAKTEPAAGSVQAEKLKALEHALADLDKQFGKGAVMKMGSDAINRDIPVIPTGCDCSRHTKFVFGCGQSHIQQSLFLC